MTWFFIKNNRVKDTQSRFITVRLTFVVVGVGAAEADADDVRRGVKELFRQLFLPDHLEGGVQWHGGEELFEAVLRPVLASDGLRLEVQFSHLGGSVLEGMEGREGKKGRTGKGKGERERKGEREGEGKKREEKEKEKERKKGKE